MYIMYTLFRVNLCGVRHVMIFLMEKRTKIQSNGFFGIVIVKILHPDAS